MDLTSFNQVVSIINIMMCEQFLSVVATAKFCFDDVVNSLSSSKMNN